MNQPYVEIAPNLFYSKLRDCPFLFIGSCAPTPILMSCAVPTTPSLLTTLHCCTICTLTPVKSTTWTRLNTLTSWQKSRRYNNDSCILQRSIVHESHCSYILTGKWTVKPVLVSLQDAICILSQSKFHRSMILNAIAVMLSGRCLPPLNYCCSALEMYARQPYFAMPRCLPPLNDFLNERSINHLQCSNNTVCISCTCTRWYRYYTEIDEPLCPLEGHRLDLLYNLSFQLRD